MTLLQNLPVLCTLQRVLRYIHLLFVLVVGSKHYFWILSESNIYDSNHVSLYPLTHTQLNYNHSSSDCSVKSLFWVLLSQMWGSPVFQKLSIEWGPSCSAQKTRMLHGGCCCERCGWAVAVTQLTMHLTLTRSSGKAREGLALP